MHEVHVRVLVSCKGYSSEWKEQTCTLEAAVMCTRVIGDRTGELRVHCKCGTTLCVEIGYIRCTTEVSFVSLEKQCLRCEGGKAKMTN